MINKIKDTDTHFIIDGSTRLVKNESETKSMLVQYDHNSERFTFRVPRYCDNHDLSLCKDHSRVHYINIDKSKRTENHGTDPIYDVQVCPEDDQFVQCSWLITKNATQLAGSLHFVIEFALKDDNGDVLYSWNTAKYTGITIQDGINFDNRTVEENNDLLTKWEERIFGNQIVSLEQTQISDAPEGENIWTATFGNGDKSNLIVKNGARGYVGSIETVQKQPLHFFAGTRAEYDALPDDKKKNLFAVFEDEAPIGNPVRASMVYKGLGDIVDESCTTKELFDELPLNTSVSFTVNTNDTKVYLTDLPNKNSVGNNYAFVTLYKGFTENYCYGLAWDIYGGMYFYKYHTGTAMDKNGWHKIYTEAENVIADKLSTPKYMHYVTIKGRNGMRYDDFEELFVSFSFISTEMIYGYNYDSVKNTLIKSVPKYLATNATGTYYIYKKPTTNYGSGTGVTDLVTAIYHDGTDLHFYYVPLSFDTGPFASNDNEERTLPFSEVTFGLSDVTGYCVPLYPAVEPQIS